jgi:hypothetical protein
VTATVAYAAAGFQQPRITGTVEVRNGEIALPQAQLALGGMTLNLPYAINHQADTLGRFAIERVQWRNRSWPAIDGLLAISGTSLEASLQWSPVQNAQLTANAELSMEGGTLQGKIIASVPQFAWQDHSVLAELFPEAGDPELGGEFSVDAELNFVGGTFRPQVEVRAQNASVSSDEWPVAIESLSGELLVTSFSPLRSSPHQRVQVHRAMVGETPIVNGIIEFQLLGGDHIAIEEARWSMNELGVFDADPFELDLSTPKITTEVKCDEVALAAWLKLMTDDRIRGEGELSGQVALTIQPLAREKFRISHGYLFAEPAGGWIQTDDSESISRILQQGTASLSGDKRLEQVRDRVVAALQNYQYTMLRLHFIPEDEGLLCTLMTQGQGRTGPNPQEIESLTINLHRFDEAIRAALAGKSLWDLAD